MSELIVPIDVLAYCVGIVDSQGPVQSFAGGTTNYTNQTTADRPAFLGINVTLGFDQSPQWPLEAGVHLHWALPDSLTRAIPNDGPMRFPPLPNRWLVTRVVGAGISKKQWIVESDTLSTTPAGGNRVPTVPIIDPTLTATGDQQSFRYLGAWEVFDTNWNEPAPKLGQTLKSLSGYELHAVATGDIAFAAFYPNTRSIFGFYDDLTDVTATPAELMYVVTGWYGTPTNDPLNAGLVLQQIETQLGWTFTSKAAGPLTSSLYSGMIQGLKWDSGRRYIDDTPKVINGDIAIGNHPAEALAAYFRGRDYPTVPAFEELLTLYATGLLPSVASPTAGQLAILDETLHELQFTGVDGGNIFTISRGTDEVSDLPLPLADALNLLNATQQASDVAAVEVRQAKWQLFSAWLRLFEVDPSNLQAALTTFTNQFNLQAGVAANQANADGALAAQQAVVTAMLTGDLTLTQTPATRYYQPTEPVLLLAGEAAAPALRYGGDGRYHPAGYLVCRLDTDVLQGLSIGKMVLKASQFSSLTPPTPNQLPSPTIALLIEEAALLNTAIGAALTGTPESTLTTDLNSWLEAGTSTLYGQAIGVLPSPVGVGAWPGENPWCSMMLLWEADFHPLLATESASGLVDYPAGFFTENYNLDPDNPRIIGYAPTAGGITVDPATIDFNPDDRQSGTLPYNGSAVLSTASADNLRNQLAKYLAHTPDMTLQNIANQLAVTDVAMQGLSGLNDALLTQQRSLQLSMGVSSTAPLPLRGATRQLTSVVKSLSDIDPIAPLPTGSYNALRAGYVKLQLQVMDPFGRKRPVQVQNTYVADSLTAISGSSAVPGVIYLQPRVVQPTRLLWRWLAADSTEYDEMNAHPATTPVCGWLLPNHISQGFFIYNAQGNPLGSLTIRADESGIAWQAAPGNQGTIDATLPTVMQHENPHLRDLAESLGSCSVACFRDFWLACDTAFAQISPLAPESQSGLGVLVGRPLAVVQAALRLERQGLAAVDQSYATLSNGVFTDTDHALGNVQFPVVIGDLQRLDDGLVGYFKTDKQGNFDTSVFYSEAAPGNDPGVVKPSISNVLLTPAAASAASLPAPQVESKLLMIVDPRTPIHATMGILPTQTLAIPADQYDDLLAGLEFTFPAEPVLRPDSGFAMPFPVIAGYNQSWITEVPIASGGSAWSVDPELQAPSTTSVWQYSPQSLTEGWMRLNPEELQFGLLNAAGAPVVTAGATTALTLTVVNKRRTPITFVPATIAPESQPVQGSVFYIHFGSLVSDANVASIQLSAPGWQFNALKDATYGSYWAATPLTNNVTLAPGASVAIAMANVVVASGTLALARVYFDYDNVTGCDDGVDEAVLTVVPVVAPLPPPPK